MNKIRSLGALSPLSGCPHRGKRCRARARNYAKPELRQSNFSEDEDDLIIKLHALLGNRWSLIAGRIPGRTDNEIRIHWETYLKKKLIKMGIDPTNHRLYHHNHYITRRYLSSSPKEHVETNVVVSDQSSSVSDSCDMTTIPISSTTNCSEDSTTSTTRIPLPDLNIGLIPMTTKTVTNPLPARCLQESTDSTNYASTSQETLVLFR